MARAEAEKMQEATMQNEQAGGVVERIEAPIDKFRRLVIDPLVRAGMRKPRRFTTAEWNDKINEMGAEFGARSAVELDRLRIALRDGAVGKRGRTFPVEIELRTLARRCFSQHVAETGGNAEGDARAAEAFARVFREGRGVMGPNIRRITRRSMLMAILRAPGGPTGADLRKAGHDVPDEWLAYGGGNGV